MPSHLPFHLQMLQEDEYLTTTLIVALANSLDQPVSVEYRDASEESSKKLDPTIRTLEELGAVVIEESQEEEGEADS